MLHIIEHTQSYSFKIHSDYEQLLHGDILGAALLTHYEGLILFSRLKPKPELLETLEQEPNTVWRYSSLFWFFGDPVRLAHLFMDLFSPEDVQNALEDLVRLKYLYQRTYYGNGEVQYLLNIPLIQAELNEMSARSKAAGKDESRVYMQPLAQSYAG